MMKLEKVVQRIGAITPDRNGKTWLTCSGNDNVVRLRFFVGLGESIVIDGIPLAQNGDEINFTIGNGINPIEDAFDLTGSGMGSTCVIIEKLKRS